MPNNKSGKDLEPCDSCDDYYYKINYDMCTRCRLYKKGAILHKFREDY